MILCDFATEEVRRVERFEAWWKSENLTDPENFPMRLKQEEWEEQYNIWIE